ncbi:MAG: transposase [Burkholderiales bacterium]|nr:transposase [Phycisphaerae bacterium]
MTDARQQRGLEIAAMFRIEQKHGIYFVPSQSSTKKYVVRMNDDYPSCSCPDYETRACKCKHIYAVEYVMSREDHADGTTTVTESVTVTATKRTTYSQNWSAYNEAQTNEKRQFQILLRDLCAGIEEPIQTRGRPRLSLKDAVFCAVFKVYSTVSARRFTSDLCDAQEKGYIDKVPHFNSIFNYLENPEVSAILTDLIMTASKPLAAVETDFAVDSTGFTSSRFVRWFDHKYNGVREAHDWVKAHLMCGVKTNIVTSIEIHQRRTADCPVLPSLVDATARNFKIGEVSADKAYGSVQNMTSIAKHGGTPYIAFKSNAKADKGGIWEKMFHYFSFNRDEYLTHYHKRSNVESTMNMIKSKFRDDVRSKSDVSMKNEVLAKVLCHNICCLINAIYELKISPQFGAALV